MTDVKEYNEMYERGGFQEVISYVEGELEMGEVTEKEKGLYCITTGGWSEDEWIFEELVCNISFFSMNHYVGYLRGGAYYFVEDKNKLDSARITIKEMEVK